MCAAVQMVMRVCVRQVFDLFSQSGGPIREKELFLFGKASWTQGYKAGQWSEQQNKKLLSAMDAECAKPSQLSAVS